MIDVAKRIAGLIFIHQVDWDDLSVAQVQLVDHFVYVAKVDIKKHSASLLGLRDQRIRTICEEH